MTSELPGTTTDVVEAWVDDDVLVAVGTEFRPRSLDGLADACRAQAWLNGTSDSKISANAGVPARP